MSQTKRRKLFLLPKNVQKVGTQNAKRNVNMWYNHKTIRYTYEPNAKELVLKFELPGTPKEDLKVFTCEAKKVINVKIKERDNFNVDLQDYPHYYEGSEYDLSYMKAKMENGLLRLYIPKKVDKQKPIEVT